MQVHETTVLIVGGSFSGLACAACLQRENIPYLLIEKEETIATPWHNHYQRLHLHTNKKRSHLPFKPFPDKVPRYPSRRQVLEYLESYQRAFGIQPLFNTAATSISYDGQQWITETNDANFHSKYVIMATGAFASPKALECPGMESFRGPLMHSSAYTTGKLFQGKKVLVIGFGNSACEIAMDLHEQGAYPYMSVRSPVNIIPRDVLGIPVVELSLLLNRLPPKIADIISSPLMRLLLGDITKLGLQKKRYGPLQQIRSDAEAPVLDIGTLQYIRSKHIQICGAIESIDGHTVCFSSGVRMEFDGIIAAIGYRRNYNCLVKVPQERFDDLRLPVKSQRFFGKDGLYFCGYWISPTGQIREIASDAKNIAAHIGTLVKQ